MNLKLIYGLIYGFFGFIVACLSAAAFYAITTALLWTFVLGDGKWPPWLLLVLALAFFLIFALLLIKFISMGLKKGTLLEEEDEEYREENYSSAKLLLKISVLSLLVFIVFLTFKFGKFQQERKGPMASMTQEEGLNQPVVTPITLRQKEKLLEMVVGIEGQSNKTYELEVEVIAVGNNEQQIVSIVQEIPLSYGRQEFVFPVSFDVLGERYQQYFSQYVPPSDKKIGIDAIFKIVAHLRLKSQNAEEGVEGKEKIEEVGRQETIARFFFSCVNTTCVVSQFDSKEEIPTEKLKNNPSDN